MAKMAAAASVAAQVYSRGRLLSHTSSSTSTRPTAFCSRWLTPPRATTPASLAPPPHLLHRLPPSRTDSAAAADALLLLQKLGNNGAEAISCSRLITSTADRKGDVRITRRPLAPAASLLQTPTYSFTFLSIAFFPSPLSCISSSSITLPLPSSTLSSLPSSHCLPPPRRTPRARHLLSAPSAPPAGATSGGDGSCLPPPRPASCLSQVGPASSCCR